MRHDDELLLVPAAGREVRRQPTSDREQNEQEHEPRPKLAVRAARRHLATPLNDRLVFGTGGARGSGRRYGPSPSKRHRRRCSLIAALGIATANFLPGRSLRYTDS